MDGAEPHNKLSREQKVGVTLLFVFSLLTAGLAFLQMRNTLVNPFVLQEAANAPKKNLKDFQVELQNIDTDKDGLSDFEELQFHSTSPYLPDTDSDGVNDKVEIDAGTDPLCAEGKECQSASATGKTIAPSLGASVETPLSALAKSLPAEGDVETTTPAQDAEALNALMQDPQKIRELLRQTGKVTEEQLSKLDDATLLKILKEILAAGPAKTEKNTPTTQKVSTTTPKTATSTPLEL